MIRDLWYVVSSVKMDLEIDTNQFDLKFYKWAVDMYKEMANANVIRMNNFKCERLPAILDPISGQRYVELPDDYVDYYKIAICMCGYIVNLDANDLICLAPPKLNCCGEQLAEQMDCIVRACETNGTGQASFPVAFSYDQTWDYFPYFKNGQFVAGMYGRGEGGYRAGYRIDYQHRRIVFDKYLKHDEIILEYKSEGLENGTAIVPAGVEKTLAYGVHWQRCMFSKVKEEKADRESFRRRYQRGLKQCIARVMAMSIVEILDIYRSSIMQAPKR